MKGDRRPRISFTSHVGMGSREHAMSLCPSVCVCLSQVGVLLQRLNVGSRKQTHTIAQGL